MSANYTWTPTSRDAFSFTNCVQAADLWKLYMTPGEFTPDNDTAQVVMNALQGYWSSRGIDQPPLDQVRQWANNTNLVERALSKLLYIDHGCKKNICAILGWEGNSDITGRGMLVTYVLQAILITAYVPALLAIRFDKIPSSKGRNPLIGRTLFALQHSTSSFLNSSFVFAIAMLSASLISFAKTFGYELQTVLATALTLLMPFSSVLPAALLQLAASNLLRRDRGRFFLWTLIGILMVIILALALIPDKPITHLDDSGWEKYDQQWEWEQACIDQKAVMHILYLALAIGGSLLLGIVGYIVTSLVLKLRHRPLGPWSHRISRWMWWTGLVLAFLGMWLCLIWFIQLQTNINSLAGEDSKDTEWSFGQILAVATWVPVIVEFGYLWLESPMDALNGRLMDPYEVREVSRKTEAFEMTRGRDDEYLVL